MKKNRFAAPFQAYGALLVSGLLLGVSCSGKGDADAAGPAHADEHGEHGEHDEHDEQGVEHEADSVELTARQMEAAGIHVETASGGEIARYLTLPAIAAANADTVIHINPKAPGIVRSIYKHLGETVEEGDLLCTIDSIELGRAAAEFVRARALVDAARTTLEREAELFEARLATARRVLDGAIEVNRRIFEREKELQERAVSTVRPLLEADKALQSSELEKERQLTDLRASRDARLLALEVDLAERRIGLDTARNALLALGVAPADLEVLEPGAPLLAGSYEIRAPRGGIVSGRHITAGEYVGTETKLYTVEDLSRVWILASAFEQNIQSVRTGQPGVVHLDAFPQLEFEGQVVLIGYEVDRESRALGVRLELDNPVLPEWPEQYPIRPGMFGRVELVVEKHPARVILPESAVVHEDDGDYVFVQTEPGRFVLRRVELGSPSGEVVEVRGGLEPGEQVAVTGTFRLKSALRQGELGEGHSH